MRMQNQVRLLREARVALVARVRLLPGVCAHVRLQVSALRESGVTHGTGVRFLPRVGAFVSLQVAWCNISNYRNCTVIFCKPI